MTFPPAARGEQITTGLVVLFAAGLIALGWMLAPDPHGHGTHTQLGLAKCGFIVYYDMPCPTCGVTTAFTHGARLQLVRSFIVQPLGFAIALLCYVSIIGGLWFFVRKESPYVWIGCWRWGWIGIGTLIFTSAAWGYKYLAYKNGW